MKDNSTVNDFENRTGDINCVSPAEKLRFEHPGEALRRIVGRERFKAEHVYGVTARRE